MLNLVIRVFVIAVTSASLAVAANASEVDYLEGAAAGARDVHGTIDAERTFELLKSGLVGKWTGHIVQSGEPVQATFYLTGNDSAIVEYIERPNRPAASMSSVYHLADEFLQLTHYCSMMNQPRLQASTVADDGTSVLFEFLDVTNLSRSGDRYTHKMLISMPSENHASVTYIGLDNGEEGELRVDLVRSAAAN